MTHSLQENEKSVAVSASASGNNTLVAAVANRSILVLRGCLIADGACTVRFEDGADGAGSHGSLTGQIPLPANGGFNIPHCDKGHFRTSEGTLLNLELSTAVNVQGWIVYSEVEDPPA